MVVYPKNERTTGSPLRGRGRDLAKRERKARNGVGCEREKEC